jgi:hypothetical protein
MGGGCTAAPFLTSALDDGGWSASRSGRFIPGGIATGTYWIGGWVGIRVCLNAMEKRKILVLPGIKPQPVAR